MLFRFVAEVRDAFSALGFEPEGVVVSPLKGAQAGNMEYLVKAVFL